MRTGIDSLIVSYPTALRSIRAIPADAGHRRVKHKNRWTICGDGWRAHIEGGHLRPRRTVIRLDTGDAGSYRAPMRPSEIISRLMEACADMGALCSWSDGTVRRVDFCLDERRSDSPAPDHIPHFSLFEAYPCGGALFLAGKKRPASRAVEIYDKTLQLQLKNDERVDEPWPHIWRIEHRFSTRSACKKAGIDSVGDALTALLVWDVVAPATPCEMMPQTFSAAWKRIRTECVSLSDVRRLCARIRASLRRIREDHPRRSIMDAVKGGEKRREHCKKAKSKGDHFLKKGICISREREGKGGGACIIIGGAFFSFWDAFSRVRGPPRAPPEKKERKKRARLKWACTCCL